MKIVKRIICGFIITAILLPIILNIAFMLFKVPSANGLGNSEWLAFYATFYGGVFGGFATLTTIYFTLKYYYQHDEEQRRLECYPLLYMYFPERSDTFLEIANIGNSPCLDIIINDFLCIGSMRTGETLEIQGLGMFGEKFFCRGKDIVVTFKDIRQNEYKRVYRQELEATNIVIGGTICSYDFYTMCDESIIRKKR